MDNSTFSLALIGVVPAVCDAEAGESARRELSVGARIAAPRGGYVHHGTYVGDGRVVHYGGLAHGIHAGPSSQVDRWLSWLLRRPNVAASSGRAAMKGAF